MFEINFSSNKNINDAMNFFILQSNENINSVLELLKYNKCLVDVLNELNLIESDFTDIDWYNLLSFCKKNDIII